MIAVVLLGAVIGLVLALAAALSWVLTRTTVLTEVHTPADFGLDFEEVSLPTFDGHRLRGWWVPAAGSDRAVVILHGHAGSIDMDVHRAPALHAAGLNVLLLDLRGHGRSEGRHITFGYREGRDVEGAVALLRQRGMHRTGLLGFSLGGIIAMLTAAVCPDVAAVVSDGAPVRMRSAMVGRGVEWGIPAWVARPLAWLILVVTRIRLGVDLSACEAVRWVGRISPRPVLFIHGDQDQYAHDFDDLYAAAGPPKELWRVPEAGHTTLSATHPDEHQRRIVAFFENRL